MGICYYNLVRRKVNKLSDQYVFSDEYMVMSI